MRRPLNGTRRPSLSHKSIVSAMSVLCALLITGVAAPSLAKKKSAPPPPPPSSATEAPKFNDPFAPPPKKPAPATTESPATGGASGAAGTTATTATTGTAPTGTIEAAAPAPKAPANPWRGQFLVGAKVGGAFAQPFGLGSSFVVGVEGGWVLPSLPYVGRGFAVTLDFAYTQPGASGDGADSRLLPAGDYRWSITEQQTSFGLTVLYRAPFVLAGKLVPYLGVGPRLFLLQVKTSGDAGASADSLAGYTEQSTRVGLGVPLGADFAIGPGRVFVEGMLLWAPQNMQVTGEGSAGAITVSAGYRLIL